MTLDANMNAETKSQCPEGNVLWNVVMAT